MKFTTLAVPVLAVLGLASAASDTTDQLQIGVIEKPTSCVRRAKAGDVVGVHYAGRLDDGTEFDNSHKRGRPFEFTLGARQVIAGWDQGILGMCIGEKRRLTIPPHLGYGDRGAGQAIPPKATLVFETELISINGEEDDKEL